MPGRHDDWTVADWASALTLPVHVYNDANASAVAEWRLGAGRGTQNFCYVTASTGIGCGIIPNGQLLGGHSGHVGESDPHHQPGSDRHRGGVTLAGDTFWDPLRAAVETSLGQDDTPIPRLSAAEFRGDVGPYGAALSLVEEEPDGQRGPSGT